LARQPGKEVNDMSTKTIKSVITYTIIVAAVLLGMTFIMSDSASAQVVLPSGAVIVRPAINQPFVAPRPFPFQQPFARPAFNPFGFNPFLFNRPVVNPFLFDDDFGFFGFEEEPFFGGFEREDD
jgi:hypothetical protein